MKTLSFQTWRKLLLYAGAYSNAQATGKGLEAAINALTDIEQIAVKEYWGDNPPDKHDEAIEAVYEYVNSQKKTTASTP